MKKYLTIIFIDILLFTVFPIEINAIDLKNNDNIFRDYTILFSNSSADLPVWENNDYWTYNIDLSFKLSDYVQGSLKLTNLCFNVISVQEEYYCLKYTGDIIGVINIADLIEGNIKNAIIEGNLYVRKMDLAIEKSLKSEISGIIERDLVTNEFNIETSIQQNISPVVSPYDFPIQENETWNVSSISLWQHINIAIDTVIPYNKDDQGPWYIDPHNFSCDGIDIIRLQNGRYNDSYHVVDTVKDYEFWYSPTAKNVVKAQYKNIFLNYNENISWNLYDINIELIKTNYIAPNTPPEKPDITGTLNGKVRTSYPYSANTNDPEEDSLYYQFDWSDGTKSNWIGPYISGRTATEFHSWKFKGDYIVKVIAKDQYGMISDWSDPLSITMPKSKEIKIPLFLQKIVQSFPFFEKILKQLI